MTQKGLEFQEVLKKAQELGYAEADPTLDVEGIDTAHKLSILLSLAYGIQVKLEDIYTEGISGITPMDIEYAKELGYTIKLLAIAKSDGGPIEARVHPTLLPADHLLSTVGGPFNAIFVKGDAVGSTLFYGAGAGMMPTGSAVVSDLVDLCRNIRLGVSRRVPLLSLSAGTFAGGGDQAHPRHHLHLLPPFHGGGPSRGSLPHLRHPGRPGHQHRFGHPEGAESGARRFPFTCSPTRPGKKNMQKALEVIDRLPVIVDKTVLIRIEDPVQDGEGEKTWGQKYMILCGDGMADYPIAELGGKTPLQAADTPNLDRMAGKGTLGMVRTVPPGFPPGSDVANLSIFGYDPALHYTGRAPLEAASMGVKLNPDDVAFRCNLVTLGLRDGREFMEDFSAGHISTEEAGDIVSRVGILPGNEGIQFFPRSQLPPSPGLERREACGESENHPAPRYFREGSRPSPSHRGGAGRKSSGSWKRRRKFFPPSGEPESTKKPGRNRPTRSGFGGRGKPHPSRP